MHGCVMYVLSRGGASKGRNGHRPHALNLEEVALQFRLFKQLLFFPFELGGELAEVDIKERGVEAGEHGSANKKQAEDVDVANKAQCKVSSREDGRPARANQQLARLPMEIIR